MIHEVSTLSSRTVSAAQPSAARGVGIALMSIGAHMLVLGVLGYMPTPQQIFAHQPVELEVIEPEPPPPPPPAPEPEKPKAPEPEPEKPRAAPKAALPPPTPTPTPDPPKAAAAEAPVDFGGFTETAGASSWSTAVGNGQALHGPVGRIATVTGRDRAGSGGPIVAAVVVPEGSLSRKPIPPGDMNDLLEKNYPPRARAQGVSGSAHLRVRIQADGQTGNIHVIKETGDYGFGAACTKILRMRRWQPPLDREGKPVASDIRYDCDFEVGY